MKITSNVYLEKSGQYFRLVEKGMSNPKKDSGNEPKEIDINVREFGTVYQALQALIEYDYDLDAESIIDLKDQLMELVSLIDYQKENIKKEFRTEVKTS